MTKTELDEKIKESIIKINKQISELIIESKTRLGYIAFELDVEIESKNLTGTEISLVAHSIYRHFREYDNNACEIDLVYCRETNKQFISIKYQQ